MNIQQNIPLAPLTTIKLGGTAKEYIACTSDQEILDALAYAKEHSLRPHVMGGGSNTVFSDTGFDGLVLHVQTKGITETKDNDTILLTVQAGEDWDGVVQYAVQQGLTGIECLSGIPGSTGATPFQNVGAYGQDVSETIMYVDAIEKETRRTVRFQNEDCNFGHRTSRFKEQDFDKYIITSVTFRLSPNKVPVAKYGELEAVLRGTQLSAGKDGLTTVRNTVLALRKKKSMVVDPKDPNSISCGSFFTNPIIPQSRLADIQKQTSDPIIAYPAGTAADGTPMVKLFAAWLIEHAGYTKGFTKGGVGISQNHSLALINKGGTTKELLALAHEIQQAVKDTFGIDLALEPIVVE